MLVEQSHSTISMLSSASTDRSRQGKEFRGLADLTYPFKNALPSQWLSNLFVLHLLVASIVLEKK